MDLISQIILEVLRSIEWGDFTLLASRFALNSVFAYILIVRIYYQVNKNLEYLFTFVIINMLIFFVSSLLGDVKLKTGFAFGLFAIFSILRYRTEQINIKEMTFLFASIIIAVSNSTVTEKVPMISILFTNITIVAVVGFLEKKWLLNYSNTLRIVYEKIELIHADKKDELMADLRERTGLNIKSYEVKKINFLSDTAELRLFYGDE